MNPRQDGRGLILMVEHLQNDDGLGWCLTVDLWKTTTCLVTSLPGGREHLTLFCHIAEVSDGSCNPEYSLEGLIVKLKLQCFGNLMQRANSLEKTLMLRKPESKRRREQQRIRWFGSITNSVDMNLSKLPEVVEDRGA